MTPFTDIAELFLIYVPTDYKQDTTELIGYVRSGLLQYSIDTSQDFTYVDATKDSITQTMIEKEQYVVALYSYRAYLRNLLDELNRGAINFKTITFEVSTLQERVKAVRNMLRDNDELLKSTFASFISSSGFSGSVSSVLGVINQVGSKIDGEWYW